MYYNIVLSRRRPGSRRKDDIELKQVVLHVAEGEEVHQAVRTEAQKHAAAGWILAAYAPDTQEN